MADAAFDFRVIGDDVGRTAAVDDVRADSRIRQDVLAQHVDGVQGQSGAVEGIASFPRLRRGVGRLAVEGDAVIVEG